MMWPAQRTTRTPLSPLHPVRPIGDRRGIRARFLLGDETQRIAELPPLPRSSPLTFPVPSGIEFAENARAPWRMSAHMGPDRPSQRDQYRAHPTVGATFGTR
jgi:hypothetical protein